MANITLIGYGKMGQVIEKVALARGHKIVSIIDPNVPKAFKEINAESLKNTDVCIDFTHPSVIVSNITKVAALGKNIVIGTTGWYEHMAQVESIVNGNNIGSIWSGNFSIGVNAFFRIVETASSIFNYVKDYDVSVNEIHHSQKADSPSGTAAMIGNIILKNMKSKTKIVTDRLNRKIEPNELNISSTRVGNVPGIHTVMFDSLADTIELKHTARTRDGFALGAVLAAEFIIGKKGFYSIEDLMNNLIQD